MEKSSFFNSVSSDRRYSAEDWAAYFASFISNGVFAEPSDNLQVLINTGMGISIKPGISFVNGYRYQNTTDLIKTLAVADGIYNRIDRVVIRWSLLDRNITAAVLQGAPATTPVAPALTRDAEIYELALADIYVGAGVTSIVQSNITDRRPDSDLCGFVTGVIDQMDFSSFAAQFNEFFAEYKDTVADQTTEFNDLLIDLEEQISQAASQSLVDKSVTFQKLANDAVKMVVENKVISPSAFFSDSTYPDFPYRASVPVCGALHTMIPDVVFDVPDATNGNYSPVSRTYDGGVYIYAASPPNSSLTIPTIIVWREGVGTW